MKIRESGMPEENYWESFFDPEKIFLKLELNNSVSDVVEFGSGYGTFTIPAAKIIRGKIHAFDIEEEMIACLSQKVAEENLSNVLVHCQDFVNGGTKLESSSVDYAMLFNILHAENPMTLLIEAYRVLKPGGKVGIIHWIHSEITPRGPSLDIRPTPLQCVDWLIQAKFEILNKQISLPPYHYGIVGMKKTDT